MKPKSIGILGGAGPLAGLSLLERLFTRSMSEYGCSKDADFPKVTLLSFPFSDMLCTELDSKQLRKELNESLKELRKGGAAILAIACNTLHVFLDETEDLTDLIHLPELIAQEIPPGQVPLILCTSTSMRFGLHNKFFSCKYPDQPIQEQIDRMIDQILRGDETQIIAKRLSKLIKAQSATTVILGCTELSLLSRHLSSSNKLIIDPLEILTKKILERSFYVSYL